MPSLGVSSLDLGRWCKPAAVFFGGVDSLCSVVGPRLEQDPRCENSLVFRLDCRELIYRRLDRVEVCRDLGSRRAIVRVIIGAVSSTLHKDEKVCEVLDLARKFLDHARLFALGFSVAVFQRPIGLAPGMFASFRSLAADQ